MAEEKKEVIYYFRRSEQSLSCEIYFPKKVAHQGTIFDALQEGYDAEKVKVYLHDNVIQLLEEFRAYPALFDPEDYTKTTRVTDPVSKEEALKRIGMYKSPFKGWTISSVDGVWFDEDKESETYGKVFEEATQVIKIIFRFKSSFENVAKEAGCEDALRNITFSTIEKQGRLYEYKIWGQEEKKFFIKNHPTWPKKKRVFVEQYYTEIAREINQWIDDRALFVFGYLVRKFAQGVLRRELYEKEIWVTGLFSQSLNIVQRVELSPQL